MKKTISEERANFLTETFYELRFQGRKLDRNEFAKIAAAHGGEYKYLKIFGDNFITVHPLGGCAMADDPLYGVVDGIRLSRATVRNIWQNLFGAFIYNSLGIPIAAGILYPFTGLLLNPMVAGAAMALSSVTVVSNANRLRRFQPARHEA